MFVRLGSDMWALRVGMIRTSGPLYAPMLCTNLNIHKLLAISNICQFPLDVGRNTNICPGIHQRPFQHILIDKAEEDKDHPCCHHTVGTQTPVSTSIWMWQWRTRTMIIHGATIRRKDSHHFIHPYGRSRGVWWPGSSMLLPYGVLTVLQWQMSHISHH